MSKWARLENNTVVEIINNDPTQRYVSEIVKQFIECDDSVNLGYKYANNTFSPPQNITIAKVQETALSAVDSAASAAYTAGFTSSANGTAMIYDSDSYTQTEIQTTAALAAASPINFAAQFPNGFPIRAKASATAAKQIIYLTAAQLITLATDWVTRYKAIKAQVWALQTEINACTTAATVEAITISIT